MSTVDLIVGPRGSGRTIRLIEWSAREGLHIVVLNHERARWVAHYAEDMGRAIPPPITYDTLIMGRAQGVSAGRGRGFLCDNMDGFLSDAARGTPVVACVFEGGLTTSHGVSEQKVALRGRQASRRRAASHRRSQFSDQGSWRLRALSCPLPEHLLKRRRG